MFDYHYIKLAIEQAQKNGEVPIGAVIVQGNNIISSAYNTSHCHAEMLAIQKGCEFVAASRLCDCDMYVTLEPCPMCAQAISFAKIRRLYFGAYNPKGGGIENGPRVLQYCNHIPEVYGGILETECSLLLKNFFKQLRSNKNSRCCEFLNNLE